MFGLCSLQLLLKSATCAIVTADSCSFRYSLWLPSLGMLVHLASVAMGCPLFREGTVPLMSASYSHLEWLVVTIVNQMTFMHAT